MGLVSAVGLYILVSIFSSGTESAARWKILAIAIVSGVVQTFILGALPSIVGLLLAVVVPVGLIMAALVFWCGVERKAALKVAASYFGLCVVLGIGASLLPR